VGTNAVSPDDLRGDAAFDKLPRSRAASLGKRTVGLIDPRRTVAMRVGDARAHITGTKHGHADRRLLELEIPVEHLGYRDDSVLRGIVRAH
jgi:hypothetical protein